jgi:hypothetical protein
MQQRLNFARALDCFTHKLRGLLPKALGAAALSAAALSAAPAHAATMQVSGRQLLDACGQPFVVRGVEQILGNQLPPGNDWVGLVDQISRSGANAVRIVTSVSTLSVSNVDQVLTLVGQKGMVAFIDPLSDDSWLARSDVKTMLKKHEAYIIIDAYGEPQYDDRDSWFSEAVDALNYVRDLGYEVPLTVTANQFGRDLPSLFEYGEDILVADPLDNTFLGWQAYWGQGGYYQGHYGYTLTEAVDAIVASGLPIQMGLDHVTDLPSETADYGTLMTKAQQNGIGWLWWDWYNPYGSENNLTRDGSAGNLTSTGNTVINSHAASISKTAKLTCSEPDEPEGPFISINSAGEAVGEFVAETAVTGGSVEVWSNITIDRSAVPAPKPPEAVYLTERYGSMTYRVRGMAARSSHQVQLHFAEVFFKQAGKRKFHVNLNGTRVLTNFDIFASAGGRYKAIMRGFDATADANGEIVVQFVRGAANLPKIDAIVVD